MLLAFKTGMNFEGALREQEQPAADQNQVAPGNPLLENREQIRGQSHDPRDRQQQRNAREHRQRQPDRATTRLLILRQPPDKNRNENDVVDPENDLERGQRRKRQPDLRIRQNLHRVLQDSRTKSNHKEHKEHIKIQREIV